MRLIPKPIALTDYDLFRKTISQSFAQKRKTMLNNLKQSVENAASILIEAGIDVNRRAETLTLDEWWKLTRTISKLQIARAVE